MVRTLFWVEIIKITFFIIKKYKESNLYNTFFLLRGHRQRAYAHAMTRKRDILWIR